MVSTTTLTSGSARMTSMFLTNRWASGRSEKSRTSRIYFTSTGSPARRATLAAFRFRTSYTPLPTVPKPKIAIFAIVSSLLSFQKCALRIVAQPDPHHRALPGEHGGQLVGGHLHGVGADGHRHLGGAIFRRGLVDGDDAGPGAADAGQQALQRAGLVPQGSHDGDELPPVFRIKNAVLIFIVGAAGQPHRPRGGRDVPRLAAGQQLFGADDFQKYFRQ